MAKAVKVKMKLFKYTKGGHGHYKEDAEDHPKSVYLRPEELDELGKPDDILVTVQAA